jgi:guanylate kinase
VSQPLLVVITGPSAVGKDTLLDRLRRSYPGAHFAITATTRAPRTGEQDAVDYYFYSVPAFEDLIARGQLLEHARVYGDWKGVPLAPVREALAEGKDVLMRTDVQGARHIKSVAPDAVTIFIAPPSIEELHRRLQARAADSDEQAALRLKIANDEMASAGEFDHVIVNDDLDVCVREIEQVLERERERPGRRAVVIG